MRTGLKKDFRKWAKGHENFMTPTIVKLLQEENFIIEISQGSDFNHISMYGVTIIEQKGFSFTNETAFQNFNKCFVDGDGLTRYKNALEYAKSCQRTIKNANKLEGVFK